jgi:hypothetical protein
MCLVWVSEQTAINSLYGIKRMVFITETACIHCAVGTESSKIQDRKGKYNITLRSVRVTTVAVEKQ